MWFEKQNGPTTRTLNHDTILKQILFKKELLKDKVDARKVFRSFNCIQLWVALFAIHLLGSAGRFGLVEDGCVESEISCLCSLLFHIFFLIF